jgi:hypothetical protein
MFEFINETLTKILPNDVKMVRIRKYFNAIYNYTNANLISYNTDLGIEMTENIDSKNFEEVQLSYYDSYNKTVKGKEYHLKIYPHMQYLCEIHSDGDFKVIYNNKLLYYIKKYKGIATLNKYIPVLLLRGQLYISFDVIPESVRIKYIIYPPETFNFNNEDICIIDKHFHIKDGEIIINKKLISERNGKIYKLSRSEISSTDNIIFIKGMLYEKVYMEYLKQKNVISSKNDIYLYIIDKYLELVANVNCIHGDNIDFDIIKIEIMKALLYDGIRFDIKQINGWLKNNDLTPLCRCI